MKKNHLKYKRINVLFSLTILLLCPFISQGQLNLDAAGKVGIGTAIPANLLDVISTNPIVRTGINSGTTSYAAFTAHDITANTSLVQLMGGSAMAGTLFGVDRKGCGQFYTNSAHLVMGTVQAFDITMGTNNTANVTIKNGGKVGIGTISPLGFLDIRTPGSTTNDINLLTLGTNAATSIKSRFMVNDGAANDRAYAWVVNSNGFNSNSKDVSGWASAAIVMMPGATDGSASNGIDFQTTTAAGTTFVSRLYIDQGGNVGIGLTNPAHKLEVTGSFNVNGAATCTTGAWGSDQMFKTDIDSLQNALATIKQLKPKTYYFDTTNVWGLNFPASKQYGFVAQELEQVLPELVASVIKNAVVDAAGNVINPATNYKAVYYLELIALLTKGIQEQQQKIDSLSIGLLAEKAKTNYQDSVNTSLQKQLNQLLTNITNCCVLNGTKSMQSYENSPSQFSMNQTDVKLTDAQSIVLEQNVPNPFAEQTSITYNLPDNTTKAQMLFYNAQGKLIQSTELSQKGKGILNVFASDLSNGIYTYTLVVDGKIIETKKMVKQ